MGIDPTAEKHKPSLHINLWLSESHIIQMETKKKLIPDKS